MTLASVVVLFIAVVVAEVERKKRSLLELLEVGLFGINPYRGYGYPGYGAPYGGYGYGGFGHHGGFGGHGHHGGFGGHGHHGGFGGHGHHHHGFGR